MYVGQVKGNLEIPQRGISGHNEVGSNIPMVILGNPIEGNLQENEGRKEIC